MIELVPEVYQDGASFYHKTKGLLVTYNTARTKTVLHDYDIEGAEHARLKFAKQFPSYVLRRHKLPSCPYCEGEGSNDFHPSHDASPRCESGGRNHCSCDTCF